MDKESSELLTPGEAARALNVSPTTLWRWARDGAVASVVLPGRGERRYRRTVIAALIASGEARDLAGDR